MTAENMISYNYLYELAHNRENFQVSQNNFYLFIYVNINMYVHTSVSSFNVKKS